MEEATSGGEKTEKNEKKQIKSQGLEYRKYLGQGVWSALGDGWMSIKTKDGGEKKLENTNLFKIGIRNKRKASKDDSSIELSSGRGNKQSEGAFEGLKPVTRNRSRSSHNIHPTKETERYQSFAKLTSELFTTQKLEDDYKLPTSQLSGSGGYPSAPKRDKNLPFKSFRTINKYIIVEPSASRSHRKEFLKSLKSLEPTLHEFQLEKKHIEWLLKALKKANSLPEETLILASKLLICNAYPTEIVAGLREKIFKAGVIKTILKLTKEGKVSVHRVIDPKEIILLDQLGKGSGGKVFSAKWQQKEIAVKICSESSIFYSTPEEFYFELAIMSILDHPNILPCLGGNSSVADCFLAMPLCKLGNLEEIIRPIDKPAQKLTWQQKVTIASKVASAMSHVHSFGILHRDLKTSNVLIGNDFDEIYLIDFGISRVYTSHRMTLNIGTTSMIAPELLEGNGKYSQKADVYSYGIMLWEIFTQSRPYEDLSSWSIPDKVMNGYRPSIPSDCPDLFRHLITDCWDQNPNKRPSFCEITQFIDKHLKI